MENNKLKLEIKQLQKQNIDPSKYKSWDHEQILFWILSLDDGRFTKYEKKLESQLGEEEISGEDLVDVNENDVTRWGINKFSDKKYLIKSIKQLINNKSGNNNYSMNEGSNAPTAYI